MIPKNCLHIDKYKLQVILTGICDTWNGYWGCCKKCSYHTSHDKDMTEWYKLLFVHNEKIKIK
jgi:hypothetical protein